jgi:16S rRNA (cytidine1402-2'-O)-methyltransferase
MPDHPPEAAVVARSSLSPGCLYLVPAPLDFGCENQAPLTDVLPLATLQTAARLQYWICESAKTTRAYLKRINALQPLLHAVQALQIQELPRAVHKKGDHLAGADSAAKQAPFDARPLLACALQGHDVGLVSEAGMPAVADPGSSVVRAAHDLGLTVVPLAGPTALVLALAASGLNGQNFAFVGYLPNESAGRAQRIRALEALALASGQTQIFIEVPYRNTALLDALLANLQAKTRLAVSYGLSLPWDNTGPGPMASGSRSASVQQWRADTRNLLRPDAPLAKLPAVFAIGV